MTQVSDRRTYVLVACVAAASIGVELMQTRVLSFLYYNHVVYLTVTVAFLGFGISGVLVSLFGDRHGNPDEPIAWLAGAFAASIPVCLAVVSRFPSIAPGQGTAVKLVLSYVGLTVPFLCAGAILGWIFTTRASRINGLYAVDLVCSSAAILGFLLMLWPLGGDYFLWLCSGVALIGFLAFSHDVVDRGSRTAIIGGWIVLAALIGDDLLGRRPDSYKTLARAYAQGVTSATVEETHWTPINRIDVWSDTVRDVVFTTPSTQASTVKMVTQDADAFTIMLGPERVQELTGKVVAGELVSALSLTYHLNPQPAESLVIGVGGGIDIVTARAHGAKRITGVEINSATVDLVSGRYRKFLQWPEWAGVELIRSEGRNFVRSKPGAYDTIVMSGVDTFAALNSGAYVLSENYLYTVEALQDYLRALKPGGTMATYRWFFLNPRESLRFASLFQAAAEASQVERPSQCILVVAEDLGWTSYRWAATFIKKQPFTSDEVRRILATVDRRKELTAIYVPDVLPDEELAQIERASASKDPASTEARRRFRQLMQAERGAARQAFFDGYHYRIDPVYDDRPFFFEYFKPGQTVGNEQPILAGLTSIRGPIGYYVLYALLAICVLACATCMVLPLWVYQRRGLQTPGAVPLVIYFGCLGAGFMLFEVGAMQVVNVYLGDPAISLAVVLAGLLLATGVGAYLASRYSPARAVSVITAGTISIAVAIVIWLVFARIVQPLTMHQGFVIRIGVVLAGLLPVGVLLGLPFPTAIRAIEQQQPRFIAWAWGVNGVTSVLSSIVAILVAMRLGFSVVVLIASATYLAAMVSFRMFERRRRQTLSA